MAADGRLMAVPAVADPVKASSRDAVARLHALGLAVATLTGWMLNPMLAAAAMSVSSLFVVSNSLRLRRFRPQPAPKCEPKSNPKPNQT